MSCIKLYREDLCHFHLLSIGNIADFVTCSSIRAAHRFCNVFFHTSCVHARACVYVVVVGDGGGQIYSKSSRSVGWWLVNVAPIVDK